MKILKFYTPTCMPCKALGKILEQINIEVENINALENLAEVDKYDICTTPTLIFLDDENKEFGRTTGLVSKNKIEEILSSSR